MQAVSGAGYPGVPSLDMIDNVVPFISTEEEKMTEETQKLLGGFDGGFQPAEFVDERRTATASPSATATPSASRSASRTPAPPDDVGAGDGGVPRQAAGARSAERAASSRSSSAASRTGPQPILDRDAENGMATIVGRVRACPLLGTKFVLLGHNTIRGAAGASILNAELFKVEGLLPV